eukprot:gene11575-15498_t
MDRVIKNIYISSIECAGNDTLLEQNNITHLISVGCITPSQSVVDIRNCLSFEHIMDSPDELIIRLFDITSKFIEHNLGNYVAGLTHPNIENEDIGIVTDDGVKLISSSPENKFQKVINNSNILVHCIYGQSRSAAIVIAYMISIGHDIAQALDILKQTHPSVCINPGFLAQLHFYYDYVTFRANMTNKNSKFVLDNIYNMLMIPKYRIDLAKYAKYKIDGDKDLLTFPFTNTSNRIYICKGCRNELCSIEDEINLTLNCKSFVNENIDQFWKDYQPISLYSSKIAKIPLSKLPSKGIHIVYPQRWMWEQIYDQACNHESFPERFDFVCPHCNILCGFMELNSLELIGIYNTTHIVALHTNSILLRRKIINNNT